MLPRIGGHVLVRLHWKKNSVDPVCTAHLRIYRLPIAATCTFRKIRAERVVRTHAPCGRVTASWVGDSCDHHASRQIHLNIHVANTDTQCILDPRNFFPLHYIRTTRSLTPVISAILLGSCQRQIYGYNNSNRYRNRLR